MKIEKVYNKKSRAWQYQTRFQMNNKEFYLKADTRSELLGLIDEIRIRERRAKHNLKVDRYFPTIEEIFKFHLARLKKEGDRKKISIFERVSKKLLDVLPSGIKFNELKKGHFQKYIDNRLAEINLQSKVNILPETVNKELSAAAVALKNVWRDYPELEDVTPPTIPKAKAKPNRRRERLVEPTLELAVLLEYLRRDHPKARVESNRRNLADDLEMRYETGFRRSEVAFLKPSQYRRDEQALRDVKRIKTGTVTKFFPLSRRAVEIIESRLENLDSEYIFSRTGKPNEAWYTVLKKICTEELGLNYGTFADDGFVGHDLRHNFATDIVRITDIETAKNLTGHSGDHILTYIHTDEKRMREAILKRQGDNRRELISFYKNIRRGKIKAKDFLLKLENLAVL